MQVEFNQSRQCKYLIVYVVKDAISYNCLTAIMQHFVVKKCFYFKTPDGAASISSPSYYGQVKRDTIVFTHSSPCRNGL